VLATLHVLAAENSGENEEDANGVGTKLLQKAIRDLGIDPEKRNPATA
jgi:hypothetical protein